MQKMEKFVLQVNVTPPHLQESKELLVPDTTAHLQGVRTPLGQGYSNSAKKSCAQKKMCTIFLNKIQLIHVTSVLFFFFFLHHFCDKYVYICKRKKNYRSESFGNKVLLFYKFGQIKKEQCIKVTKALIC